MVFARINQGSIQRPGGGLPFYLNAAFAAQRRGDMRVLNYYTWLTTQDEGVPFQVLTTGGSITALRLVGAANTAASYILNVNILEAECLNGTDLFITYDGRDWGPAVTAGTYYFEIVIDGATILYSDWFFACSTRAAACHTIKWKDTKDWVGAQYYGGGYENKILVETNFARPTIDYVEETIDDGFGNLLPTYQRTEEVYSCDIIACDSQVWVLYNIAQHDTVTITSPLGGEANAINTVRCSDTGERKDALAVIEFSFKVDYTENTTIDEPTLALGTC